MHHKPPYGRTTNLTNVQRLARTIRSSQMDDDIAASPTPTILVLCELLVIKASMDTVSVHLAARAASIPPHLQFEFSLSLKSAAGCSFAHDPFLTVLTRRVADFHPLPGHVFESHTCANGCCGSRKP